MEEENKSFQKKPGNRWGQKRSYAKPVMDKKEFKGHVPDLDGHVFDSITRISIEKFNEVLENIRIYVGRTYKHPDMVIEAIDQMKKPLLAEPPDFDASATMIKKKLWEERAKRFIEKE